MDHIVSVPDTVRGLVLLGLPERYANYAAYALHAVFSYPTSDNWLPGLSKAMPIHIAKMDRTCWGKNWGTYERIDWVDDVEIDEVRRNSKIFYSVPNGYRHLVLWVSY